MVHNMEKASIDARTKDGWAIAEMILAARVTKDDDALERARQLLQDHLADMRSNGRTTEDQAPK